MKRRIAKSYVRTTLTIPKELYARLKARRDLNWSAIAAEAFEDALLYEGELSLLERVQKLEGWRKSVERGS